MRLSERVWRPVTRACILFVTYSFAVIGPIYLLLTMTNHQGWLIVLLPIQFALAGVVDWVSTHAIRREVPDFPLKANQYSAGQQLFIREWRRRMLPKALLIVIPAFLLIIVSGPFYTWLTGLILLIPVPLQVLVLLLALFITVAAGKYTGTLMAHTKVKFAEELLSRSSDMH